MCQAWLCGWLMNGWVVHEWVGGCVRRGCVVVSWVCVNVVVSYLSDVLLWACVVLQISCFSLYDEKNYKEKCLGTSCNI